MARSQPGIAALPPGYSHQPGDDQRDEQDRPGDRGRLQVDLREALVAAVTAQPADGLAAPSEQEEQAERG
jgi:hypothetical protein